VRAAPRNLGPNEKDNLALVTPMRLPFTRSTFRHDLFWWPFSFPDSLIVGAIVIMNIMLVSVTERTKEIGLRKSLGAREGRHPEQFLFEALTLATIGGAVGIFLAWVVGKIVTATFFPTYLSILAVLGALAASGGWEFFPGIVPAWKAARLDPMRLYAPTASEGSRP